MGLNIFSKKPTKLQTRVFNKIWNKGKAGLVNSKRSHGPHYGGQVWVMWEHKYANRTDIFGSVSWKLVIAHATSRWRISAELVEPFKCKLTRKQAKKLMKWNLASLKIKKNKQLQQNHEDFFGKENGIESIKERHNI